jgi:ribosomal protein S18 acetylase RimI-like enzyme
LALERVRVAGAKRFVLEVLEHNTATQTLYTKHGFGITRTLRCYQKTLGVTAVTEPVPHQPGILDALDEVAYNGFVPTWQNQLAAYRNEADAFYVAGIVQRDTVLAYGIIHRASGSILQMGVHPAYRDDTVCDALVAQLAHAVGMQQVRIVNIEADSWLDRQFVASGWQNFINQYEMERRLA